MVQDELDALEHDKRQVTLSGPAVVLPSRTTEVLLLAVHELATNAMKYGALSVPGGKLQVSWTTPRQDGGTWLHLDWVESGVPDVAPPSRNGFGSELITRRVPYELLGKATLDFTPGGVRCVIEFPLRDTASALQSESLEAANGDEE